MLKLLERYIAKTIISSTLLTASIITAVLFLINLLSEMRGVGKGDYGFLQAVFHTVLQLPNAIYQFSPLLILIGTLLGLSALAAARELAVMRAAGFSIWQITRATLVAAFCLTIAMTFLGEMLGPSLSFRAEVRKENAEHPGQAIVTSKGAWFHVGNNFLHVGEVVNRELLKQITWFEFDENQHLLATYYVEKFRYIDKTWWMFNGVGTAFYPEQTKHLAFTKKPLNIAFNANLLNVGLVDPNQMPINRLRKFSRYLQENGIHSTAYRFEFWRRILQPITTLVMVLLAIPFVFGNIGTASIGKRITLGILIGFAFYLLNAMSGQLAIVYQLPEWFAALLLPCAFGALGIFLVFRTKQ